MVALLGSLEEHMDQAVDCLLWQNQFSTLSPRRGAFLLGTWLFPCLWSGPEGSGELQVRARIWRRLWTQNVWTFVGVAALSLSS